MELECTMHAAMELTVNGSHLWVNVEIGPSGKTDLNTIAIEEHQAELILVHPDPTKAAMRTQTSDRIGCLGGSTETP
jgi:hypothetical protein